MKLYGWYDCENDMFLYGIRCIDVDMREVETITNTGEFRLRNCTKSGMWYKTFTQAKMECMARWKIKLETTQQAITLLKKQKRSEVK